MTERAKKKEVEWIAHYEKTCGVCKYCEYVNPLNFRPPSYSNAYYKCKKHDFKTLFRAVCKDWQKTYTK